MLSRLISEWEITRVLDVPRHHFKAGSGLAHLGSRLQTNARIEISGGGGGVGEGWGGGVGAGGGDVTIGWAILQSRAIQDLASPSRR